MPDNSWNERQPTAAAKSAWFWMKIFYFHVLARHHWATQGSHPNTYYARWTDRRGLLVGVMLHLQSFGESFQDFQYFLLALHLPMPRTGVGDPCALWPFTRSEIWVVFQLHYSLCDSEMKEMLLSCCCMWAQRASLGQQGLMTHSLTVSPRLLSGSHVHAARTKTNWCPHFLIPSTCLISWPPKVDSEWNIWKNKAMDKDYNRRVIIIKKELLDNWIDNWMDICG